MKTWTDTLTLSALAAVLLLGGCTSGDGSVSLEVDEEAVAEVLAELDEMRVARLSAPESTGSGETPGWQGALKDE